MMFAPWLSLPIAKRPTKGSYLSKYIHGTQSALCPGHGFLNQSLTTLLRSFHRSIVLTTALFPMSRPVLRYSCWTIPETKYPGHSCCPHSVRFLTPVSHRTLPVCSMPGLTQTSPLSGMRRDVARFHFTNCAGQYRGDFLRHALPADALSRPLDISIRQRETIRTRESEYGAHWSRSMACNAETSSEIDGICVRRRYSSRHWSAHHRMGHNPPPYFHSHESIYN